MSRLIHAVAPDIAMVDRADTLQDLFLESRGRPVRIGRLTVIQMDSVSIPEIAEVRVSFLGDRIYCNNAAVIAIDNPGYVCLSDGTPATAVAIWDDVELPRSAVHVINSHGRPLQIYNKYKIRHSDGFVTEDSFTGNAGMVISEMSDTKRKYECSNGLNGFNKYDLVFEVEWIALS